MLSVEEALEKILDFVTAVGLEDKPILDCLGQVLAKDIYSNFDVPPSDNSAMDGYATKSVSIKGATPENPKVLRVIGQIPAGASNILSVEKDTAVRIMTGAVIPNGADVVVPFEETDENSRGKFQNNNRAKIGIFKTLKTGSNIRRKGEDISSGNLVLSKGRVLAPADIGVLASLGNSKSIRHSTSRYWYLVNR